MSGGRASSVGAPPVAGWIDPAWLEEKCDHVVCVLCFGVMVEPTSGCPEGHSFCLVCYGKALAQRRDCPTCRHAVDEKWMVRMRPLEGMISQLRMRRCEHAEEVEKDAAESSAAKRAKLAPAASNMTVEALRRELRQRGLEAAGNKPVLVARLEEDRTNRAQGGGGCGWSGGVGELAAHLGGECAWAPVKCPNQGCTESPLRKDLSAHEAICGSRQVKCRHCQMQTETRSLAAHEERCPQEDAACPNEGCRTPHPRWSMAVHLATCEHEAVVCPCEGCDEFVLRKDVDAHLEATHLCAGAGAQLLRSAYSRIAALEEDAKSEERHAAGTSSLTAMGESTLSRGVTPTTVWVFNWRADGGWERDATSKMRDNGDGLSGVCRLVSGSGPPFLGFHFCGTARCSVHATFSILDTHDKTLREVVEVGTASRPKAVDHLFDGDDFWLTAEEKALSLREDGSVRLRAVVRLFLESAVYDSDEY